MNVRGALEQLLLSTLPRLAGSRRLTRQHVIWAYRILLDRDPENEAVIRLYCDAYGTTGELRAALMASPEFQAKTQDIAYSVDSNVVIKEFESGLRLFADLSDVVALRMIRGQYEPNETAFVQNTVKPGETVLDVGAHLGWFTTTMATSVGSDGLVWAFEPCDRMASLLARSLHENRLEDRVRLVRAALADRSGRGRLVSPTYTLFSGGSHLVLEEGDLPSGHEAHDVPLLTLDEYALHRPVSFIKIDVEGAEALVFRGAEALLRKDQPVILSEILPSQLWKVSGCAPGAFIAEMASRGYECRALEGGRPGRRLTDSPGLQSVVFLPLH